MTEWRAFDQLEPFGGAVDDLRAGLGPSVAINMNRKEGAKTIGPLTFYPWHEETVKAEKKPLILSVAETAARLRKLLGGGPK